MADSHGPAHNAGAALGGMIKETVKEGEFGLKTFFKGIVLGVVGVESAFESYFTMTDEGKFMYCAGKLKDDEPLLWRFVDYIFPQIGNDSPTNWRINHVQNKFRTFVLNYGPEPKEGKKRTDRYSLAFLKKIVEIIKSEANETDGFEKAYQWLTQADVPMGRKIFLNTKSTMLQIEAFKKSTSEQKGFAAWIARKICP